MGTIQEWRAKGLRVNDRQVKETWAEQLGGAGRAIFEWREQHPRATLTEIEDACDEILRRVRADIVSDAASLSETGRQRQACPECGRKMVRRGERERRLLGKDGSELHLRRSYQVCPACGAELFPPG